MPKFSKHHTKLACWSPWTQDGSSRPRDKKVIGGSLRKGETKQNKAVLVLFKCVLKNFKFLKAVYREHPTSKIQIATWTSSQFGAWGHSNFETNQHQLRFLHNFRWYLRVPFRWNWWRTERKVGKISWKLLVKYKPLLIVCVIHKYNSYNDECRTHNPACGTHWILAVWVPGLTTAFF